MALDPRVADLTAFDLLLAAIETGSLSKAAEQRGLAQPSVSARIRSLERRLGVPLLRRSPSGVVPTPAGQTIAGWAQDLLDAAQALADGVSAFQSASRNAARIASSFTISEYLMPEWLAHIRTERPEVSIELIVESSGHVIDDVKAGVVELGFVEGSGIPTGVQCEVVGLDQLVVVVAPNHPWARREAPVSAREISESPFVLRERGSGTRLVFEEALAAAGLGIGPPIAVLSSTAAVRAAVMADVGPGVVSIRSVRSVLEMGLLVAVPVTELHLGRPFHAVWRRGRRPPLLASLVGAPFNPTSEAMDGGAWHRRPQRPRLDLVEVHVP